MDYRSYCSFCRYCYLFDSKEDYLTRVDNTIYPWLADNCTDLVYLDFKQDCDVLRDYFSFSNKIKLLLTF
jgi:hypothetical protein